MFADDGRCVPVSKGRILLVEDDPLFQRLVQGVLAREGYDACCFATSGEEAMDLVSDCAPDLVLMDISLEGDLNGFETAERIQGVVNVPVVFLSSHTDQAVLEQIRRAGPYGFVSKPFRSEQLVVAVETAFHRYRLDRHVLDSRDWLSTVLGSVADSVISIDIGGSVTYVNAAGETLLGRSCLGRSLVEVLSQAMTGSDDDIDEFVSRVLDEQTAAAVDQLITVARPDGEERMVHLASRPLKDPSSEPIGAVLILRDVTEKERLFKDLTDSMRAEDEIRKLNRAVEQSPALVVITDVEGTIEYVNPQFCETTGYSVEEAIGQNPRVLKGSETVEAVYDDLWSTITQGGTWSGEFHNRKKDGSNYWAFACISGLRDDTGVIRHYVGVQVDISRRKQLEVELEAQNAELERLNRLKSDMVAITSHDLKSPLHAMVSIAKLLRDLGPNLDADRRAGFVDQIISSGHKLSSFISDILDTEKIESNGISLVLAPTRLNEVIEDCVAIARAGGRDKGVEVTLTADSSFAPTLADAGRLEQVFNNLLSNALKFAPEKSTIEIALSHEPGVQVVTVGDRGPGIPEADIERIFSRYFQASSGAHVAERGFGVGLGLFITRQLVETHGGSVTAENREGGGCLFVVRLPVADPDGLRAAGTEEGGVRVREERA